MISEFDALIRVVCPDEVYMIPASASKIIDPLEDWEDEFTSLRMDKMHVYLCNISPDDINDPDTLLLMQSDNSDQMLFVPVEFEFMNVGLRLQ